MVKTRNQVSRRRSRNRSYLRRRKSSPCHKKRASTCRHLPGCRMAMGRKRSFCRKAKNTKRVRGGRRRMKGGEGFGMFRRA